MATKEQFIFETIKNRMAEIAAHPKVKRKLNNFKTDDEAQEWLTKVAIATLFGV